MCARALCMLWLYLFKLFGIHFLVFWQYSAIIKKRYCHFLSLRRMFFNSLIRLRLFRCWISFPLSSLFLIFPLSCFLFLSSFFWDCSMLLSVILEILILGNVFNLEELFLFLIIPFSLHPFLVSMAVPCLLREYYLEMVVCLLFFCLFLFLVFLFSTLSLFSLGIIFIFLLVI